MRGFAPFLLLLAAKVGITAGHVVKAQQHDGSRALSEVFDANEVDMFYRRLDPHPDDCCGMCTEIELSAEVVRLLVSIDGTLSYGQLNPFGLSVDITIIIRLTIEYTDNTATDTEAVVVLPFDVKVQPADWNETPCSYLEEGCKVFENDEILMFGPDAPGDFAILSLETVNTFTDQTNVNVISTECTVLCEDAALCAEFEVDTIELAPDSDGTPFGAPTQSAFNNGFCPSTIFRDPHVTGLRGQRYDWSGEDGGWYAFLSTQDQLQMNLRVTSHLPETFPERQLVTGVAVVTEGGHTITVDIVDPLDLAPTCEEPANAGDSSAPCLVNGGLRVTVDGREELQGAGEYGFDGGIQITAVNLPLECQRFGDYLMWGGLDEGQKLMHAGRRLLSSTSIFDWLLKDSVMVAPPWCLKYLAELDGDVTALAGVQSNHAVLRIDTPNLSLRVNVGINSEQEQTLEDGRVVPTASFWQMDVRVEHAEGMATAKGMLGETARLVHDKQTGKAVMSGLGVLRGDVEDYRVMHPLGTEFKQMFVQEED